MMTQVFDFDSLLKKYHGDEKTARELAVLFFQELPKAQQKINQAFNTQDLDLLKDTVHRLKGSLSAVNVSPSLQKIILELYLDLHQTSVNFRELNKIIIQFNHIVSKIMVFQKDFS